MTDKLVRDAQQVFLPVWQETHGNDGYVSFELDPLLGGSGVEPGAFEAGERVRAVGAGVVGGPSQPDDQSAGHARRSGCPRRTGRRRRDGQCHLDFHVAAVSAGARRGVARAQRRKHLTQFKSVYSIFVSRLDVYTEKAVPQLSPAAQGMVGILNAKRIWAENQQYWAERPTPLRQEIVFASTGTKKPSDPPWKYVEAFAGSDIQTNPPATNEAVAKSDRVFTRQVDRLPPAAVVEEIDRLVDMDKLEATLMAEGIAKFANPQKALLALVAKKRQAVA